MILVTGSLAFDYIMDYQGVFSDHIMPEKIHTLNLSFLVNTLKKQKGGTAGNIAYNLALLNSPVSIFAAAGNDFSEYSAFLKNAGVDISNIQIIEGKPTASAFIMTDKEDNQITGFYPGAMSESVNFSLSRVKPAPEFVVISPNDPKAIIKLSEECRELNIPFMVDIGMQLPALEADEIKQILQGSVVLIGNDYEISLLKEKTSLDDQQLISLAEILITTLGAKGSTIQNSKKIFAIPAAKPKEILDPTGAGDAYRAGFLAGYLKGLDLQICGQMGSITSCYTVEKYGTTSHTFTMDEFKHRYKENFGQDLNL